MHLFTTVAALRCYLQSLAVENPPPTVGLVPTMGALHPGHLSLIQRAKQDHPVVIVTIFVNPLQFAPTEDFQHYPRQLEQDRQACEEMGVSVIFAPTPAELGIGAGEGELTQVVPAPGLTAGLCGQFRPGHFTGVATIVTKLLNLIQPTQAYFGEKDAQQLAIIRHIVQDLNIPVDIIGCPIVREASGLAYSSRNQYLTPAEKQDASLLYQSVQAGKQVFLQGKREANEIKAAVAATLNTQPTIAVEYIALVDPQTLTPLERVEVAGLLAIAARVGTTRLIDNVILRCRQPIIAIDGPAGAGKSTISRQVAEHLGLLFLDTGAMYRAVTWLVLQAGIPLDDHPHIAELASQCQIQFLLPNAPSETTRILINDQDVTDAIRTAAVTAQVSTVAAQAAVRQILVNHQRRFGEKGGLVAEGRDIGTHVFPDAEVKIFLTASIAERARRRQLDLQRQGQPSISLEQLQQDIAQRDYQDSHRTVSPLRKAVDAIEVLTDSLSIAQVRDQIIQLYHDYQAPKT